MLRINICIIFFVLACNYAFADKKPNKYSREANEPNFQAVKAETYDSQFSKLQRPFRVGKLNFVWDKATKRLEEPKLKSLYLELKIQDREEIEWKQLKSQNKDKYGLKENELRLKLKGIMSSYDLLNHFEETGDTEKMKSFKKFHDPEERRINKSIFKDKRLTNLWEKAEVSGFTAEELKSLKEEFHHHQDKIDVYYSLLENVDSHVDVNKHENAIDEDEWDISNMISSDRNNNEIETPISTSRKYESNVNKLREHNRGIKNHYNRLERLVSAGPHSQDFIEPKVQALWRVAQTSNFTNNELSSIKSELHHFESRLLKLRHMHAEQSLLREKYKNEKYKDKTNRFDDMEDIIKKQSRKIEKIQDTIEKTIFKHNEL